MHVWNPACRWFTSYLSNRTQKVKLGHCISNPLPITTRVPPGCILTTRAPQCSISNAKSSLYADDSTFDCSGQPAKEVLKVLQSSLLQANTWLNTNRLVVNASKSSFMLLGNTKNSDCLQDIILNNVKLEHTISSTKLLGLHIQTDFAWKEHITSVVKSLSSKNWVGRQSVFSGPSEYVESKRLV